MLDKVLQTVKGGIARDSANDRIARGDAARDRRAWEEAAGHYRAALDRNPSLAPIWVQLGHMLKESGRREEAESAYREALALADEADTHLQLGHLHKIMGRRREAEDDYLRALERQPDLADARAELGRMGWNGARLRGRLAKEGAVPAAEDTTRTCIAFELSDLIDHLQDNRNLTGIQRVQLALAQSLKQYYDDLSVQFVYYDHGRYAFHEILHQQIAQIIEIVNDFENDDDARITAASRLKHDILEAASFSFPKYCYLVNVGTSWGYWNYFLTIREIKLLSNIRYVPLVHDCIPLLYPEFCNPHLVRDFINWITNMFGHADLILTNSENTKADVIKVAEELGAKLPPAVTIRLDGEYGDHAASTVSPDRASWDALRVHNLDVEDFVLFVSTIEPRKNHILALNAWSRMLKSRPRDAVPRLVCVGSSGWMNEAFHQRVERDSALQERVVVLQNVSEQVLQLLYRRCMFTLFPSLYEGWGLPISEALAYGKIPLVSNVSSHPEAGGDLAVYFDIDSEADLQAKLESLIDDVETRRSREKTIAMSSPLRPWRNIAKEVFDAVERHLAATPAANALAENAEAAPAIACGRYYSFARNLAPNLQTLSFSGESFRAGMSWHAPEPFGCWIRGLSADIAFSLAQEAGDDFLVFLHWTGSSNIDNAVILSAPPSSWTKRVAIPRGEARWDSIPLHFSSQVKRDVRIRITAEAIDDFGAVTGTRDARLASAGLKGLFVCRASDSLQRMALLEAIQLGDLDALGRRFGRYAAL